jgi:glutathione S-transferase
MSTPYRLMTIGPSHYCEKARWALDFFGVDYTEDKHPPMVHWLWSLPSGGGRTVPILRAGSEVIGESSDILHHLDREHGNGQRLYPVDDGLRAEVEQLEERFDTRLGPHTRRVVYFHLLPERKLAIETIGPGVGGVQKMVFRAGFPFFRFMMFRGMNITPTSAERSLDSTRQVFHAVDERLADGREFLVGDSFTAADLTFAALAAPVLLPPGYGAALPGLDDLPSDVLTLVEEFRSTTAGDFALRIYEDHR